MKGASRKLISLTLAVLMLFSLLSLTACNRRYDEEEVLAAAKDLLKRAEMLNEVYYGSGIKYFDSEDKVGLYYCKADKMHLGELGFSTIEELKKITEQTFSARYSATVYSTVLTSLKNENGVIVTPARYHQQTDENTGAPTDILVHSNYPALFKSTLEYDYDSMRVEGSKKEKVNLLVDATVTNSDGLSQKAVVTVTLVEEENGWRIDNPTYVNYNDALDKYNELKDKDIK